MSDTRLIALLIAWPMMWAWVSFRYGFPFLEAGIVAWFTLSVSAAFRAGVMLAYRRIRGESS